MYESNSALQPLLWGLSPQSWRFKDERDTGMLAGIPRWEQLLSAAGFQKVSSFNTARVAVRSPAPCLHGLKPGAAAWRVGACVSMHHALPAGHGEEGARGRQRSHAVPQEG